MALIEWNDKELCVGIELIDSQHKVLIGYINDLSDLVHTKSSEKDVHNLFQKSVDYSQYHFDAEEAYFESLNTSDLELHKLQHKHFIEQLNQFSITKLTPDLLEFLLEWLVIHIQCEDKKFIQTEQALSKSTIKQLTV